MLLIICDRMSNSIETLAHNKAEYNLRVLLALNQDVIFSNK